MRIHWVSICKSEPDFPTHWVDHQVLNLKILTKSFPLKLPNEFITLSDRVSWENPKKPPLWEKSRTFWRIEGGAFDSEGLHIEEKELKETFSETSWNRGTPLTLNFPSDKSNKDSVLMRSRFLEFGGAMERKDKNRGKKQSKKQQEEKVEVKNLTLWWSIYNKFFTRVLQKNKWVSKKRKDIGPNYYKNSRKYSRIKKKKSVSFLNEDI